MRITVLAGGVGAARFLDGLIQVNDPATTTAIVNVGDDFELLGLAISPDLDTIHYTLAGLVHPEQGWGRAEETANALDTVGQLGGPTWFFLGDRDLGLHLFRTEQLRAGRSLSAVTADVRAALGLQISTLPATDDRLRTMVETPSGELDFQTYFVARQHKDTVVGVRYDGAETARPAPGVIAAIESSDALVIAPSNPYLSVGPILAIPELARAVAAFQGPRVAVSPIVGGKAVKGPAAELLNRFAGSSTVVALAEHYGETVSHLLIDERDRDAAGELRHMGLVVDTTDTLMHDRSARRRVAEHVLALASRRP